MTIEGRAYFLNKLPLGSSFDIPKDTEFAGKLKVDWGGLLGALISACIWDTGFTPFLNRFDEERRISILSSNEVEITKNDKRVTLSDDEINREHITAASFLPGVVLRIRHKTTPEVITFSSSDYKILP
ncbi:MAG: hypothetical protein M1142_06755 [Patescibacteria group bacterium]|nr:hypothetical protein [Patescibacteria group bacterium]